MKNFDVDNFGTILRNRLNFINGVKSLKKWEKMKIRLKIPGFGISKITLLMPFFACEYYRLQS